jgi:hypothetical protein
MIDALIKRVSVTYKYYEMYAHWGKRRRFSLYSFHCILFCFSNKGEKIENIFLVLFVSCYIEYLHIEGYC